MFNKPKNDVEKAINEYYQTRGLDNDNATSDYNENYDNEQNIVYRIFEKLLPVAIIILIISFIVIYCDTTTEKIEVSTTFETSNSEIMYPENNTFTDTIFLKNITPNKTYTLKYVLLYDVNSDDPKTISVQTAKFTPKTDECEMTAKIKLPIADLNDLASANMALYYGISDNIHNGYLTYEPVQISK